MNAAESPNSTPKTEDRQATSGTLVRRSHGTAPQPHGQRRGCDNHKSTCNVHRAPRCRAGPLPGKPHDARSAMLRIALFFGQAAITSTRMNAAESPNSTPKTEDRQATSGTLVRRSHGTAPQPHGQRRGCDNHKSTCNVHRAPRCRAGPLPGKPHDARSAMLRIALFFGQAAITSTRMNAAESPNSTPKTEDRQATSGTLVRRSHGTAPQPHGQRRGCDNHKSTCNVHRAPRCRAGPLPGKPHDARSQLPVGVRRESQHGRSADAERGSWSSSGCWQHSCIGAGDSRSAEGDGRSAAGGSEQSAVDCADVSGVLGTRLW